MLLNVFSLLFLGLIVVLVCYFGSISFLVYLALTIAEITILKAIYIYKYSKIAVVNENFISCILVKVNITLVSMNTLVRLLLNEYDSSPFLAYRNRHNQKTDHHKEAVR